MKKKTPPPSKIKVHILDEIKYPETPSKQNFKHWVHTALSKMRNTQSIDVQEVSICLVDSEKSATLNEQYRHKKGPTNVLAFEYPPMPGIPAETLGDLIICSPIVATEAADQQKNIHAHFAHLTIHGLLHLLGYDHVADAEAHHMEQLETQLLLELGFSDPYS